ncbi:MAG: DsbA family protein [Gammaproteobacteria bacterium]|nr:DsbA family protein [Gammaproteobacteria bacterium]
MCSWCYAFKAILKQLRQQLPNDMEFISILGGLAIDTDLPMPADMRQQLQATWQRIEQKVPDIQFNYDFWNNWQQTHPRRATYPACRAVIAAHYFDQNDNDHTYEELMIDAIQNAYYKHALNPSDDSVLIKLSGEIGLDEDLFKAELKSIQTQQELDKQILQSQQMNALSYPSLVLKVDQSFWPVSIDYHSTDSMLQTIHMLIEFE